MSEDTGLLVKFYSRAATIRGPEGEYVDSLGNYELDAGRPPPPLPGGRNFIGRTYVPGKYHNLSDGVSDKAQAIPYPTGDNILAGLQQLLDNQAARRALEVDPPSPLDELRIAAIDALMDERVANGTVPPQAITDYVAARDR